MVNLVRKPLNTGGGPNEEISLCCLTNYSPNIIFKILETLSAHKSISIFEASFYDFSVPRATYQNVIDNSPEISISRPNHINLRRLLSKKVLFGIKLVTDFQGVPIVVGLKPYIWQDCVIYNIWTNQNDIYNEKIFSEDHAINNLYSYLAIFKDLVSNIDFSYAGYGNEINFRLPQPQELVDNTGNLAFVSGFYSEQVLSLLNNEKIYKLLESSEYEFIKGKGLFYIWTEQIRGWLLKSRSYRPVQEWENFRDYILSIPGSQFSKLNDELRKV
ncbi:MAG TPA: hypothetical protein ACFYEK_17885 [Candidatus Wunengus sp. YC60]|uniref:hypothetical protein n=1 Tax=Candidatus Wunengus sp. YC60 TaxID=3367697 RepID=UPI004028A168